MDSRQPNPRWLAPRPSRPGPRSLRANCGLATRTRINNLASSQPRAERPNCYHFKDGSNPWWTAVQIRNHRNPIAQLEYYAAGSWVSVPRTSYNYFVQTNPGMGPGPYTFRVTDSYGNMLTDTGISPIENGTVSGAGQFPAGP